MATRTKKGPEKIWTRRAMIQAGVDWIIEWDELPTATTWRFKLEGRPTATTVINEFKDAEGKHGWSRFVTQVKSAYKKQTGKTAPAPVKGGSGKKGVSRYADRPGMRPAKPRSAKWNDETPTAPEPIVVHVPDSEPVVEPRKGFWKRLFS